MAEFGKRRSVQSARTSERPSAAPADLAAAIAAVRAGKLPGWAKIGPTRLMIFMLVVAIGFWWLLLPYTGDLLRDYRLAGTWQAAYDMQVTSSKCTRYNLSLTICNASLKSRSEPERAPLAVDFMMAFSSGRGESLVPVRSTVDPSAVTIAYAAETKRLNRTITLIMSAGIFIALFVVLFSRLLQGRYVGGAAHRALLAGVAELQARSESARASPQVTL